MRRSVWTSAIALLTAVVASTVLTASGRACGVAAADSGPRFTLGITHNQQSADGWGDPRAIDRARAQLTGLDIYQNQHLMGFGALNPEPSPGRYDWDSLDERMALIRETGGTPVITLCCAPDWMKGGKPGTTDWSRLEEAPLPEHFGDFADLAAATARRYPQVRHYQVWNELKGFYDSDRNDWDYEGYTRLYNDVYDALKKVNPDIQVGGPYVSVDSWSVASQMSDPSTLDGRWGVADRRALDVLQYWLAHAHGADFLTVDGSADTRDRGTITDPVAATRKYEAVSAWIRQRSTLPIWWAEFNVPGDTERVWGNQYPAVVVVTILRMIAGGANGALLWSPEYDPEVPLLALWTSTHDRSGGQPTPLAEPMQKLASVLAGTLKDPAVSWTTGVGVLRSSTGTLLVNATQRDRTVLVDGVRLIVQPGQVRLLSDDVPDCRES
jgi:hypothetical protein